jgi:hypothetical protein
MSILTQDTEETSGESTNRAVREPIIRAFRMALENTESGRSSGSSGRGLARTFLLIDLGAAIGYLLGDRGSTSNGTDSIAEMVSEPASGAGTEIQIEDQQSGGRSTLSKLFLLGAVVGIGYVLRTRMGSMDRVVDRATERARTVSDEAAMRSGEAAGRTETTAQEAAETIEETGDRAAERIQEGSEMAADRVEEGGQQAADQMESAGESVEEVEGQMEAKADEMTEGGEGSDEGEE